MSGHRNTGGRWGRRGSWEQITWVLYVAVNNYNFIVNNNCEKILNQVETKSALHFERNPPTAPKSLVWRWCYAGRETSRRWFPGSGQEMPSPELGSGNANREKRTDLRGLGVYWMWGQGREKGLRQLGGWWHLSVRWGLRRGRFEWELDFWFRQMECKAVGLSQVEMMSR